MILPKEIVEKINHSDGMLSLDLYTYGVSVANVVFTVDNNAWSLPDITVEPKNTYPADFRFMLNKTIK